MPNLVGIGNSQVPTNAMLGGLAYQDSVGEINIDKIKARTSDTATDVFVYDTRKDSDGGAWRHRTQNTTWYNEGVSATRGARKEFPAVAVIVCITNGLLIYDGDDPNLPLWMEWTTTNGSKMLRGPTAGKIAAMNGIIALSNASTFGGVVVIYFISDTSRSYRQLTSSNSSEGYWRGNGIASRNDFSANNYNNSDSSVSHILPALKDENTKDVAITVLPNAPIDPDTGLPRPTIAVATLTGPCIIKDDDKTVTDGGDSSSVSDIHISKDNRLYFTFTSFAQAREVYGPDSWTNQGFFGSHQFVSGEPQAPAGSGNAWKITTGAYGTDAGLVLHDPDPDPTPPDADNNNGMVAYATTSYNSGWQQGNIAVAVLSSTDTTDLTGTNLYSDNFSDNGNGWGISDNGSDGIASGVLTIANNASARATDSNALTGAATGTKLSVSYTVTFGGAGTLTLDDDGAGAGVGGVTNILQSTASGSETQKVSTIYTKTASDRIRFIRTGGGNFTIDDLVVKILPVDDRSVNNDGLAVYGTITKDVVAPGADLVYYGGFSDSNYLYQPYNSDLDFGTGDLYIMFWMKNTQNDAYDDLIHRRAHNGSSYTGNGWYAQMGNDQNITLKDSATGASRGAIDADSSELAWQHICFVRRDNITYSYKNGILQRNTYAWTENLDNSSAVLTIGRGTISGSGDSDKTFLALVRIGADAPTEEQIKKIYYDEKGLYSDNAKCTLYGTSDTVTALAYDDSNTILHAGTSSGRSEFQGLNRINNTTTAVTTAISASNGFVAEQ